MNLEHTQTTTGNTNSTQTTFDYRETCRRGVFLPVAFIDINDGMNTDAQIFAQIVYWHEPDSNGKSRLRFLEDGRLWLMKYHGQWFKEIRIKKATVRKAVKRIEQRGLIHYKSDSENTDAPLIAINWAEFKRRLKIWADNGGDKVIEKKYTQLMALYENLEPLPDDPPPPQPETVTVTDQTKTSVVRQPKTRDPNRSLMAELWEQWEKESETVTYDDILEERKNGYLKPYVNTEMLESKACDTITAPDIESQDLTPTPPVIQSQGMLPDNSPPGTQSQEGDTQSQPTLLPDNEKVLPDNSPYIKIKEKKEKEIFDKQNLAMNSVSKNLIKKQNAEPNNISPSPSDEIMTAIKRVFDGDESLNKSIYILLTGCDSETPQLDDSLWYKSRLKYPVTAQDIYEFESWYTHKMGSNKTMLREPKSLESMFNIYHHEKALEAKTSVANASV